MEAPFGVTFLRKAELYNLVVRLDSEFEEIKKKGSKYPSLWPIEKAILKWTYFGHKHLGSAIKTDHLSLGNKDSKLADFEMLNKEGKLKEDFKVLNGKVALHKPLENIVIRGFGEYFDNANHGHNAIIVNKDGLLLGELLTEINKGNRFILFHYTIYGEIMNHLGGFILLLVTIMTLAILFITFIEKILVLFKYLHVI